MEAMTEKVMKRQVEKVAGMILDFYNNIIQWVDTKSALINAYENWQQHQQPPLSQIPFEVFALGCMLYHAGRDLASYNPEGKKYLDAVIRFYEVLQPIHQLFIQIDHALRKQDQLRFEEQLLQKLRESIPLIIKAADEHGSERAHVRRLDDMIKKREDPRLILNETKRLVEKVKQTRDTTTELYAVPIALQNKEHWESVVQDIAKGLTLNAVIQSVEAMHSQNPRIMEPVLKLAMLSASEIQSEILSKAKQEFVDDDHFQCPGDLAAAMRRLLENQIELNEVALDFDFTYQYLLRPDVSFSRLRDRLAFLQLVRRIYQRSLVIKYINQKSDGSIPLVHLCCMYFELARGQNLLDLAYFDVPEHQWKRVCENLISFAMEVIKKEDEASPASSLDISEEAEEDEDDEEGEEDDEEDEDDEEMNDFIVDDDEEDNEAQIGRGNWKPLSLERIKEKEKRQAKANLMRTRRKQLVAFPKTSGNGPWPWDNFFESMLRDGRDFRDIFLEVLDSPQVKPLDGISMILTQFLNSYGDIFLAWEDSAQAAQHLSQWLQHGKAIFEKGRSQFLLAHDGDPEYVDFLAGVWGFVELVQSQGYDWQIPSWRREPAYHVYRIIHLECWKGLFLHKFRNGLPLESEADKLREMFLADGLLPRIKKDEYFEARLQSLKQKVGYSLVDQFWALLPEQGRQLCADIVSLLGTELSLWINPETGRYYQGHQLRTRLRDLLLRLQTRVNDGEKKSDAHVFVMNAIDRYARAISYVETCPANSAKVIRSTTRHGRYCIWEEEEEEADDVIETDTTPWTENIASEMVSLLDFPDEETQEDFEESLAIHLLNIDCPATARDSANHYDGSRPHGNHYEFPDVHNILLATAYMMSRLSKKDAVIQWKHNNDDDGNRADALDVDAPSSSASKRKHDEEEDEDDEEGSAEEGPAPKKRRFKLMKRSLRESPY